MVLTKKGFQPRKTFQQWLFCLWKLSHPGEISTVIQPVNRHLPVIIQLSLPRKFNGLTRKLYGIGQSALRLSQMSRFAQCCDGFRMILPENTTAGLYCLPHDQLCLIELALHPE